jgi:hypothetical protein
LMCGVIAQASEPWERLPPTPTLPTYTVGKYKMVNGVRLWYAEWGADRPGTPRVTISWGCAMQRKIIGHNRNSGVRSFGRPI